MKTVYTLEKCLDILEWFGDVSFSHVAHALQVKIDGEERARKALPAMRRRAQWLVKIHAGTACAYPGRLN